MTSMDFFTLVGVLFLFLMASVEIAEASLAREETMDVAAVKIGGSSISDKGRLLETLNATALHWFATTLAAHISDRFRAPTSSSCPTATNLSMSDSSATAPSSSELAFVVVHGAGSFGHHTAKQFGLQGYKTTGTSGSDNAHQSGSTLKESSREIQRKTMQGLVRTRQSVQRLNALVVQALVDSGINAVAISPCFGSIPSLPLAPSPAEEVSSTALALRRTVELALRAGLVPVLHGDACLVEETGQNDEEAAAAILSGDTLLEWLGSASWVSRAVFLTDVDGVYTQDPKSNPSARLVRDIAVSRDENGDLVTVVDGGRIDASGSEHDHDVTGGLKVRWWEGSLRTVALEF
jgi:isopentenyl phosphate kinase